MDAVVHTQTDDQDRDDLCDLGELAEHAEALEQPARTLHPDDREQDREHRDTGVCECAPHRAQASRVATRTHPVHEQQHRNDDRERGAEEPSELLLEVEAVLEQQRERERSDLDAVGRLLAQELCDGELAFDLQVEVAGGLEEHEQQADLGAVAVRRRRDELAHEAELLGGGGERLVVQRAERGGVERRRVDAGLRRAELDGCEIADDRGLRRVADEQVGELTLEQRARHLLRDRVGLGRDDVTVLDADDDLHDALDRLFTEQFADAFRGDDLVVLGGEAVLTGRHLHVGREPSEHAGECEADQHDHDGGTLDDPCEQADDGLHRDLGCGSGPGACLGGQDFWDSGVA